MCLTLKTIQNGLKTLFLLRNRVVGVKNAKFSSGSTENNFGATGSGFTTLILIKANYFVIFFELVAVSDVLSSIRHGLRLLLCFLRDPVARGTAAGSPLVPQEPQRSRLQSHPGKEFSVLWSRAILASAN